MTIRKIDLMHREFGFSPSNRCKNCNNFLHGRYRSRTLSKCTVYGCTHSEASDWSGRYDACGMYNQEYHGNPMIRLVRGYPTPPEEIQGQETLFEGE